MKVTHDRPISPRPILRWLIAGPLLALFLVPLALSAFDAMSNSDVDSPARTSTSYVPSYSSRYGESSGIIEYGDSMSGLIDAEERAEEGYDRAAEAAERADEAARLAAETERRLRWLEYDQQQLEWERDFEQITGCYVAC